MSPPPPPPQKQKQQQTAAVKRPAADTPPSSQSSGLGTTASPVRSHHLCAKPPLSPPANTRPAKRACAVRITCPEPGSIYDIMHDNQGESLYQYPICWTDAHARLLDVQFVPQNTVTKPVPDVHSFSPTSTPPPRPSRVATELSKDLTAILNPRPTHFESAFIKQVMATFFPATLCKPKSDVDFEFHFGRRTLNKAVRVAVLWKHPDGPAGTSFDNTVARPATSIGRIAPSDSQMGKWNSINTSPQPERPILAFVNRAHLAMVRRNLYRIQPGPPDGDSLNTPVLNIQKVRSKKLIPEDSDRDSYLVAVMVAIAQAQCYPPCVASKSSSQRSSRRPASVAQLAPLQPVFKDVPVRIVSQDSDSDTASFVVYNTIVTAAFLKRFADPITAPDSDALHGRGLKIDVTRIPVWPVLGLKERLAQALGSEISGEEPSEIANGAIETWESEQERSLRVGSLKRGRHVLADIFNTSFDLDAADSTRRPSFSIPSPGTGASLGIIAASPPVSPRAPKRRRTESRNELKVC